MSDQERPDEQLLVATRNRGKIAEFARLLKNLPVRTLGLDEVGITLEVEEIGATFSENADLKAVNYARLANLLTIADDSGLVVDALGGAPGVHSARYAGPKATDSERIEKLLSKLYGVPESERTARFVCSISIAAGDGTIVYRSEAICEGRIAHEPCGHGGFGYDPIFVPEAHTQTFAELPSEVKNQISHRARATVSAVRFLQGFLACLT